MSTGIERVAMGYARVWFAAGFGLLECLVVVLLLSLAVVVVTAGLQQFWQRHRLNSVSWDVFALLQFAQTVAQERQQSVVVCGSEKGLQCDGEWAKGLLLFYGHAGWVDTPNNLLRFYANHSSGSIDIDWRGFLSHDYLRFDASGIGRAMSGRFTLRSSPDARRQSIVLNRIGRMRLEME
jgi:type IV fimbrial biogenesis protein FimT